jgi:hypothetical protein
MFLLKLFYRWNYIIGVNYSTNDYQGYYENSLFRSNNELYGILAKYHVIRIPIQFDYTLPFETVQPFFSVAYQNIFLLKPEFAVNSIYDSYKSVRNTIDNDLDQLQTGISVGIGVKYKLKNGDYVFLNNIIEYRKPFANFNKVQHYHFVKSVFNCVGYGIKIK